MLYRTVRAGLAFLTYYFVPDFPDKITLGKCANGKRLVAKVVKRQSNKNNVAKNKITEDVVLKQIAGNEQNSK